MTDHTAPPAAPSKKRGRDKLAKIPVHIQPTDNPLPKPDWIRVRLPADNRVDTLKALLRQNRLVTVCEEAACPNLSECFSQGTATFMILGDKCTRRCSFCDVAHGRPDPIDPEEPAHLATTIAHMGLRYVVITSVDRDDLRDGGAQHFVDCMRAIRAQSPAIQLEILVPDFRGRVETALAILVQEPPHIFNHNLETVPRLYRAARPGSDYAGSLALLQAFKAACPHVPTKSGLMLGLGEQPEEILPVLSDLRAHGVDMVTLGQYLQPSRYHLPVDRYVTPAEFKHWAEVAKNMGFSRVASGPLVRSSYHADQQAQHDMVPA